MNNSNLYISQLTEYNTNYTDASDTVKKLINNFQQLLDSFSSASGDDIKRINNDLEKIISALTAIKTKIDNSYEITNTRANNCDKVYVMTLKVSNTPSWSNNDYTFKSNNDMNMTIKNGIIYRTETFRKIPKPVDNIVGQLLFPSTYETIQTTVKADKESMFEGLLKWV